MKFLADVNIAQSVIYFLRQLGHEVLDSKKDYLHSSDIQIIIIAKREKRLILTRDKDYIDLVQLPKYQVPTIVFRLLDQKPDSIIKHLKELLLNQQEKILNNSLTIVTEESADSSLYKYTS